MAWGFKNKEEEDKALPESLRGKTPEQIAASLAESEALKAKLVDLEAKQTEQNTRFESFGQQLTQLNTTLTEAFKPRPVVQNQTELADFITNPDLAFAQRSAPIINATMQTQAILARNQAIERARHREATKKGNIDGRLFERFASEVDELAKNVAPQHLGVPETWEHLFFNVKGRHADEIAEQNRDRKGEFFIEPTTTSQRSDEGSPDKLTPLEEKLATKMGVKPEQYLAQKKKMVTGVPEEMLQ